MLLYQGTTPGRGAAQGREEAAAGSGYGSVCHPRGTIPLRHGMAWHRDQAVPGRAGVVTRLMAWHREADWGWGGTPWP